MRFEFKVEVYHTFIQLDELKIEVTADNLEDAESMARDRAYIETTRSSFDAEHEESNIEHIELINTIPEDDEDPLPVRCDLTPDMFTNPKELDVYKEGV